MEIQLSSVSLKVEKQEFKPIKNSELRMKNCGCCAWLFLYTFTWDS